VKRGMRRRKAGSTIDAAAPAAGCCNTQTRRRSRGHHVLPRLRRHAKWMFAALALVFASGSSDSVGAGGVGFGFSGVKAAAAYRRCRTRSSAPSTIPKDAQAFRDLATAEQAAKRDGAIEALGDFVALRPRTRMLSGSSRACISRKRATLGTRADRRLSRGVPGSGTASKGDQLGGKPRP
jgi:hypothetical protein